MMTRAEIIMCLFECDCYTLTNMELPSHHFGKHVGLREIGLICFMNLVAI
jgi:hypothetical protein